MLLISHARNVPHYRTKCFAIFLYVWYINICFSLCALLYMLFCVCLFFFTLIIACTFLLRFLILFLVFCGRCETHVSLCVCAVCVICYIMWTTTKCTYTVHGLCFAFELQLQLQLHTMKWKLVRSPIWREMLESNFELFFLSASSSSSSLLVSPFFCFLFFLFGFDSKAFFLRLL